MREIHFAIPSTKYFAPFSPMPRLRFKEVRVTHFAISSPKNFAPFSLIFFYSRLIWIEYIKSLDVYFSFSISSCRFYAFIESLSIESFYFCISICIFRNIWSQMVFFLDFNSFPFFMIFFFNSQLQIWNRMFFLLILLNIPRYLWN